VPYEQQVALAKWMISNRALIIKAGTVFELPSIRLIENSKGRRRSLTIMPLAMGRLQHSSPANRPGPSENLWMGSRGAYPAEAMVGAWIGEKRYFRPGTFPHVSTTGNWQDVGHFTQVIWKRRTHVGCAVYRDERWDFLICRYSPKGNVDGRQVP
jgi:hypothetical protein